MAIASRGKRLLHCTVCTYERAPTEAPKELVSA